MEKEGRGGEIREREEKREKGERTYNKMRRENS